VALGLGAVISSTADPLLLIQMLEIRQKRLLLQAGGKRGAGEVVPWCFSFLCVAQTGARVLPAAVCLWEQSCCSSMKPREINFS